MNAMVDVQSGGLQWYAVRMREPFNAGRRTVLTDVEPEVCRVSGGALRVRAKKGTGRRRFVQEVILERAGFTVFLPVQKVWRIVNSRTKERRLVARPVLSDWLFVGWPAAECRWHELSDLGVVSGVLGTGGRPAPIPKRDMVAIMDQFGGGELLPEHRDYIRDRCGCEVGDMVRVAIGPFEGFDGQLIDVSGGTARVVIDIFGRDNELPISVDGLEPVYQRNG